MSAKVIKLTDRKTGAIYELELNLKSISNLEKRGVNYQTLIHDMPVTALYEVFSESFEMHCPKTSANVRKELYDLAKGKKLSTALIEMYNDATDALGDENEEGNAMWEQSW